MRFPNVRRHVPGDRAEPGLHNKPLAFVFLQHKHWMNGAEQKH